jgi:transcriptional regulator with XRE-family HTH domain
MTLKEFAARSGLSVSYVNQLERNRNPKTNEPIVPSLETFSKVAIAIGITLDELLSMVDENQPVGLESTSARRPLSSAEQTLLCRYRALDPEGRAALSKYAEFLASSSSGSNDDSQDQVG